MESPQHPSPKTNRLFRKTVTDSLQAVDVNDIRLMLGQQVVEAGQQRFTPG